MDKDKFNESGQNALQMSPLREEVTRFYVNLQKDKCTFNLK